MSMHITNLAALRPEHIGSLVDIRSGDYRMFGVLGAVVERHNGWVSITIAGRTENFPDGAEIRIGAGQS